ncbi:MAG: Crp/Fnr family transcriptional regulator [Firmicutes bacterium]|nr:Crp/Fnr family transcriptional regulator [Bacillota bacterium]
MPIRIPHIDKEAVAKEVFSLWPSLTDSQRELLASHMQVGRHKKGEIIYRDTDSPGRMYFLVSGKVKVAKAGVGGREQIIRVIKPVEMFGYRAYFAHAHHRSTATAFETSLVASLPMEIIERVMCENAQLGLQVVRHLAVLLGQSDDRTVNLTQKHIRGRLAEALLFLKDHYGLEDDGETLNISLSREDLANLSNMTTSNAIRTLSSFATEQLIATDGKKIRIIDEEELRHVSRMG